MPPTTNHIASQLRQLIYYNLDCNLLRNALFLAGRLTACESKLPEAAYLQALCHFRLGQFRAAYDSCKILGSKGTHLGCSYIFAQTCLALEKYLEGIHALERSKGLWSVRNNWNKHTETRRQHLPDAPAVYCLLGKLAQAHKDTTQAIEYYAEALKLNPFMWDAFLGLCDLGVNIRLPNIFKMTPEMMSGLAAGSSEETPLGVLEDSPPSNTSFSQQTATSQPTSSNDPFSISTSRLNGDSRINASKSALFEKLNGSRSTVTPIGGGGVHDFEGMDTPIAAGGGITAEIVYDRDTALTTSEQNAAAEPPLAPMRKPRTLYGLGMDFGIDAPPRMKTSSWRSKPKSQSQSEEVDHPDTKVSAAINIGIGDRKRTVSGHVSQAAPNMAALQLSASSNDPSAPQRRSARLFNQIRPQSTKFSSSTSTIGTRDGRELKKAKATGTKGRSTNGSTVGRVVSGNRKHGDPMDIDGKEVRTTATSGVLTSHPKPATNDKAKEFEGLQWLLDLFMKLGSGYFALSHYQCQEAIQLFNSITPSQRETPWVLASIGRALYEELSYAEAAKYFARVKAMAPSRIEDIEVYSTTLWHLKNETDLAYLAHEISDIDRLSPQAWCAIGNSFSLSRDREQALKCFKRATQLDPKFTYAFALQGHEHIANEEYDKAIASFRSCLAIESRYYGAWYGLGSAFEEQGKYDVAEQHYRTAARINPTHPVLLGCVGTVLEKMKNPKAALLQYNKACELAPKQTPSRFKKARVLLELQEPNLALAELKILRDLVPDDARVHFFLGKVYKLLRQRGNAIKHFTTALNLDPKVCAMTISIWKKC